MPRFTFFLRCVMLFGLLGCNSNWPKSYVSAWPDVAPPSTDKTLQVTWMGTAGIYATDGTTAILIDPFVSRYGLLRVGLGLKLQPRTDLVEQWTEKLRMENVALVLVSHSHYDHSMDAPLFAALTGGILVGSESTLNIGRGVGLPNRMMQKVTPGQPIHVGDFKITFIESTHGKALFGRVPYPGEVREPLLTPASVGAYKLGAAYSILVEHPLGTFLHHGSAGFIPGMFDGVRADVVMLGIAGREDSKNYVGQVVNAVGAKRIIAIHFDDFFKPLAQPIAPLWFVKYDEFVETIKQHHPDLKLETLPLGQPRRLF